MQELFMKFVAPPLAALIATLLVAVLKRYLSKLGIEIDAVQETRLKELAKDAIRAAEEAARRQPTMSGVDKKKVASEIVQDARPDLSLDQVHLALDANLPDVRAELKGTGTFPASQARTATH